MAIKKKEFDFSEIKSKFSSSTKYKPDRYYSCGEAFLEMSGLEGPAVGHINQLIGHTDSGKTTALIAAAVSAQKMGDLPIFIITEKKWSFEHAKLMGFECEKKEETGEWDGLFIYRDDFLYIEQITDFINELLDAQAKGDVKYNICFFWDSVGSIPCKMTYDGKGGKQHTAGVLSEKIGMGINQRINSTRKEGVPFDATMVIVNQPWVELPDNPFGQPKIKPKGGESIQLNSTLVFLFGNEKNSGVHKISATKNKRKVVFASRTKITVKKNHINGLGYADGKIILTPHGFILDSDTAIEKYKKEHLDYWAKLLGSSDFNLVYDDDNSEDNEEESED